MRGNGLDVLIFGEALLELLLLLLNSLEARVSDVSNRRFSISASVLMRNFRECKVSPFLS